MKIKIDRRKLFLHWGCSGFFGCYKSRCLGYKLTHSCSTFESKKSEKRLNQLIGEKLSEFGNICWILFSPQPQPTTRSYKYSGVELNFALENWPIREAKISHVTDLIGWFQHSVKIYARIIFIALGPGQKYSRNKKPLSFLIQIGKILF